MAVVGTHVTIRVPCEMCGRPFYVTCPVRTEPLEGSAVGVVIDSDHLHAAVLVHLRQHQN